MHFNCRHPLCLLLVWLSAAAMCGSTRAIFSMNHIHWIHFPFETSIFLVNTVHAQSETFSRDLVQRRDVLQRSCPCVQIAYRELVKRSFIEISKAILARDRRDPAGDPPQRSCQDYRELVQRSCQKTSHRDHVHGVVFGWRLGGILVVPRWLSLS